jgi:hypothetical protein
MSLIYNCPHIALRAKNHMDKWYNRFTFDYRYSLPLVIIRRLLNVWTFTLGNH